MAQSEAYLRQAESASTAAKTLLAQRGESAQNDSNEAHDRQVCSLFKRKLMKSNNTIHYFIDNTVEEQN